MLSLSEPLFVGDGSELSDDDFLLVDLSLELDRIEGLIGLGEL